MNATSLRTRVDRVAAARQVLAGVPDPEVPAISVQELGIVRDVLVQGELLEIVLTPTYSGCPATEVIERSVLEAIDAAGLGPAVVRMRRSPAWTTDWISAAGHRKLREYGIAPPMAVDAAQGHGGAAPLRFTPAAQVGASPECPRCGSPGTERLSSFGSTACKALYRCLACREPFEYFKPI